MTRTRGTVTVFLLNRHLTETAELDMRLTGFAGASLALHKVMEGHDLRATNCPTHPTGRAAGRQRPRGRGRAPKGRLAPLSYHVVRLERELSAWCMPGSA